MRKLLQLKMYSFLSSRWGMTFCVVGLFVTLNAFFQIVQILISRESMVLVSQEYTQNVGGKSYQHIMCADPIDIVYTWVNGSDPRHKKAVAEYKRAVRDPTMKACNATQTPDKDFCYKDEDTASRFIDNEELRYSLRSIEAFAPWVRHIYLVTNGQVPSWINTEHPRLTVITHAQIFTNKSHLPTFSSPSIEVHLHRIPGLSKKFIYLNDDVMFGRDVFPDDFYTLNAGQKVFLSWAVPNCAEGCPPNWVGDGYCDLACNVSACDFDAHDCDNYTSPTSYTSRTGFGGTTVDNTQRYKNYCSKGCPDSWIGDKYCDRMCKNLECAFDAGDCGVEDIFGSMHGVQITNATRAISLPSGLPSVYFNLSDIVGSATITDGSHDNVELVRTATISQKFKIMTLTFHRNISFQEVMLSVTAENVTEGGNKTIIEKSFNITLDTIILPSNETTPEDASTGSPGNAASTTNITSPESPAASAAAGADASTITTTTTTTTVPGPPGVIALEPAQQPPRDAAIESQIERGSGGMHERGSGGMHERGSGGMHERGSGGTRDNTHSQPAPAVNDALLDDTVPVPVESAVPVETKQQQEPVVDDAAKSVASSNTGSQQQAPAETSQDPLKNSLQDTSKIHTTSQEKDITRESLQTVQSEEVEGLSELSLQGQPEARQPANYDSQGSEQAKGQDNGRDKDQDNGQGKEQNDKEQNDKEQGKEQDKDNNTHPKQTKEKDADHDHDQAEAHPVHNEDNEKALNQELSELRRRSDTLTQKPIEALDEGVLKEDAVISLDESTRTDSTKAEPIHGDNELNLDQKFVLANPDAADSSGALKNQDIAGGDNGDAEQPVMPGKFSKENLGPDAGDHPALYKGKAAKSDQILFKKMAKSDDKDFKKNEKAEANDQQQIKLTLPESAKNERPPNARDILSIPIYDEDTEDESNSAFATPSPSNSVRSKLSDNEADAEAEEYKKWYEGMTLRKKLDLEQMAESKKELEEIESRFRQNRETEKQLAEEDDEFPWEIEPKRQAILESKGGGRKLLDDFADSLKHVNKLYTAAFGAAARKVPAHMPHMIDKDIMEELQSKWPNEWNATSSHRLRSGADMQYAFAYFYYLIHARVDYNLTNVWETELDMDRDGELNDNELRTLGVHLHGAPLKPQAFEEVKERLVNACIALREADPSWERPSYEDLEDNGENGENVVHYCSITLRVLESDNKTAEEIKKVFSKKNKYRHQIEGTDEVAFLMIGNNDSVVQGKLDGIRTKRQKFICLNDNMNHSSSDTAAVVKVLHDLYTAILPIPSSFELPPNVRNAYLYIGEIMDAKEAAKRARQYEMAVGLTAIGLILCLVYRCRKYASRADRRVKERRAKKLLHSGGIS